jgi:hypothetical protein
MIRSALVGAFCGLVTFYWLVPDRTPYEIYTEGYKDGYQAITKERNSDDKSVVPCEEERRLRVEQEDRSKQPHQRGFI